MTTPAQDGWRRDPEIDPILHLLPADQLDRVLNSAMCDIAPEFLGFTEIYLHLAQIIPLHWIVVDLGCAYAPQAFVFDQHKAYVGVDTGGIERFKAANTTHHEVTIEDFIARHLGDFNLDETFAICSYVPRWGGDNMKRVRDAFKNVFTYYPHGGPHVELARTAIAKKITPRGEWRP